MSLADPTGLDAPILDADDPRALEIHARFVTRLGERPAVGHPPCVDARLAHHNVATGVRNLLAHRRRLAQELPPSFEWRRIEDLMDLALACVVAHVQVERAEGRPPDQRLAHLLDERNRLWAWLVADHQELRRAGYWLWLEECDDHVPPLSAHD